MECLAASSHTVLVPPLGPARTYVIEGGRPLRGTITVGGAKNAVTKQMVATLLTDEPCLLQNVPHTTEIAATLRMLAGLGTQHTWLGRSTLELHTPRLADYAIGPEHERLNRIPLLAISPLLHRAGEARVPLPGGCPIGARPADFHLSLLGQMGARVEVDPEGFVASGRLHGAMVELPYPSVGATESALLAAVLAPGESIIANAAVEPEIMDTIGFLQSMGARIRLQPRRKIIVEGVRRLFGARHRVIGDRTEAASFAFAAAATGGRIEVRGVDGRHLEPLVEVFRALGGCWETTPLGIAFSCRSGLRPVFVQTGPWPGFSTDWLPALVVALTQASGRSGVHETVFESRLGYAEMLSAAGARFSVSDWCVGGPCRFCGGGHLHSCTVRPSRLRAARLAAPDLRGGFAMVVAALVADGRSEILHMERVERGYAYLADKLDALGARLHIAYGMRRAA